MKVGAVGLAREIHEAQAQVDLVDDEAVRFEDLQRVLFQDAHGALDTRFRRAHRLAIAVPGREREQDEWQHDRGRDQRQPGTAADRRTASILSVFRHASSVAKR